MMKIIAILFGACVSSAAFSPFSDRRISPADGLSFTTPVVLRPTYALFAGGFGGRDVTKKGAKALTKQVKLKPKQQWDRYLDMKTEKKIRVGIRMEEDESEEWFEVGHIRSKEGANTAVAVAIQRALIAEHAKRLYPLQVSSKKTLEWAYFDVEKGAWTVVDKSILDDQTPPDGIEKQIGFEGTPDPASGFYCVYDGGKLKIGEESSFK